MNRRYRAGIAAALALGLAAGGAAARPAGAPFPSYVDAHGRWEVLSNAHWRVTPSVKAREVRETSFDLTAFPGEKTTVLWTPTCSRGQQTVKFSRTVDVPGVPSTGRFVFRAYSYPTQVIGSAQFLVNGHLVAGLAGKDLATTATVDLQLTAAKLRAFRLGQNELEVIATKRPLPAAAPACNGSSPTDVVGVMFGFAAGSEADLSVSPGTAQGQYRRGGVYQFNGTFKVRNDGPSAALPGSFEFVLAVPPLVGAFSTLKGPVAGAAPFGSCTTEGDLTSRLTLSCPYTVFPAGQTATISFGTVLKIPADASPAGVYTIDAQWTAFSHAPGDEYGATDDPKMENNRFEEVLFLCGPKATDPKCPAAGG